MYQRLSSSIGLHYIHYITSLVFHPSRTSPLIWGWKRSLKFQRQKQSNNSLDTLFDSFSRKETDFFLFLIMSNDTLLWIIFVRIRIKIERNYLSSYIYIYIQNFTKYVPFITREYVFLERLNFFFFFWTLYEHDLSIRRRYEYAVKIIKSSEVKSKKKRTH